MGFSCVPGLINIEKIRRRGETIHLSQCSLTPGSNVRTNSAGPGSVGRFGTTLSEIFREVELPVPSQAPFILLPFAAFFKVRALLPWLLLIVIRGDAVRGHAARWQCDGP